MRRAALFALLLAALAPAGARADGPAFEGTGQARIVNEDRVAARRRALDDAMRQAVEHAVDGLLGPEARASRPNEVRAATSQARALVERYRVLSEGESGGLYQVKIEATIDPQRLAAALGHGPAPRPAAGPAVSLRAAGPGGPAAPGSLAACRRALMDVGVALQPPPAGRDLAVTRTVVDEGEVRGADVVAARVALSATLRGAAGAPDRTFTADARRFAPDAATARAAAEAAAATELAQAVARALAPARQGGHPLRLVGRFGYRQYRAFAQALAMFPQITGVAPRRFGRRWADLWVDTSLSPAELGRRAVQVVAPGLRQVLERADDSEVRVRLEVTEGEPPEGLP